MPAVNANKLALSGRRLSGKIMNIDKKAGLKGL
jgi:hypothetical protein